MSKTLLPFAVPDLSAFAKALRTRLAGLDHTPTHVEMLNLLAKSAGHQNFQAVRAGTLPASIPAFDQARIDRVIGHFDDRGRMIRWPGRTRHQDLCIWIIWSTIPRDKPLSEKEINGFINDGHHFGDHALLRRSLVDMKMLSRTPDGKLYRRIEKQPDAEAQALMAAILPRLSARPD